ncbi:MAG: sigma-70 family RNA polymerase sigma factor [Anaerolineae bacterium]
MITIVLPDVSADDALLDRARLNDQEAQRLIYERYFPPVFQFIRLRLRDREQARDIAADVFLDFFVALRGKNPPRTHLRGWLFQVARNKIYDHYGHEQQFPQTTLDEWMPNTADPGPESQVIQSLQAEKARQVLSMLVAEQQEVLILRFGQGLSIKETADLMGRSVSATKSLQFRAVDTLRQILDAREGV